MIRSIRRSAVLPAIAAVFVSLLATLSGNAAGAVSTPRAVCGPGSHPETGMQGRVSLDDVTSGYAAASIRCNAQPVGHFGATGLTGGAGGYRTHRYIDPSGRECAYYDSTLLFPLNVPTAGANLPGVVVLDMTNPAAPVKTDNLVTPAMLSPHESLNLSRSRGLLIAVMGNPLQAPGVVDIYDLTQDCRHPVLLSSTPVGVIGHEGAIAPDGLTYYVTSTRASIVTAVDISDPTAPRILWQGNHNFHGLNISTDGTRLYAADFAPSGVRILDVSQVQAREENPVVTQIGHVTWPLVSTPQTAIPVTIGGAPYLVEIDEFSTGLLQGTTRGNVGAARIISIADERNPVVVSDIRLEVNETSNQEAIANDPGAGWFLGGYTGHYCAVPRENEPGIVACSFILSGLRVFDIRDPLAPKEIAYFNAPIPKPSGLEVPGGSGGSVIPHAAYAMSAPTFAPERNEVWYTDGNFGFFSARLTNGVWSP